MNTGSLALVSVFWAPRLGQSRPWVLGAGCRPHLPGGPEFQKATRRSPGGDCSPWMPCLGGAAVAVVTAERSKAAAGLGGVGLGCAQMPVWPWSPACLTDAVCGGPGGDWA